MGRRLLVSVVMVSGCFDFDLLQRPFDDLSASSSDLAGAVADLTVAAGADLAGADFAGADLSAESPDLGGIDLAGADLIPCIPPPSFIGRVFYVAPGGSGDGTTAAMPSGSINATVQRAIMA